MQTPTNGPASRAARTAEPPLSLREFGAERAPDSPAFPGDDQMDWQSEPEPAKAERFQFPDRTGPR